VVVSAPKGLALGPVRGKVRLATTGVDGTGKGLPFDIQVTGTVVTDLVATPGVFAFGSFPAGTPKTCSVTLEALAPGATFRFTGATVDGERVRPARAGERAGRADRYGQRALVEADLDRAQRPRLRHLRRHGRDPHRSPELPSLRVPYNGNATQ
jgi:hypothetical protein